jgi:hypothetical protein
MVILQCPINKLGIGYLREVAWRVSQWRLTYRRFWALELFKISRISCTIIHKFYVLLIIHFMRQISVYSLMIQLYEKVVLHHFTDSCKHWTKTDLHASFTIRLNIKIITNYWKRLSNCLLIFSVYLIWDSWI